jgi:DNA-binding protein H-NS
MSVDETPPKLVLSASAQAVAAKRARRREGIEKVLSVMSEYGLDLTDLTDRPLYQSRLPAKYQDSAGNTWTGIGRRPRWVQRVVEAGIDIEDYRI